MSTYEGVMDCYGVETFVPQDERDTFLRIRAMANAQRHALFYQVELDDKDKEYVDSLLARDDYEGACVFIKSHDTFVNHGPGKDKLIPNKELDPWG
tara:strand:- start:36892 stop:37179 length:288 start_codon:yes stop_codon:yes gene_type:complete